MNGEIRLLLVDDERDFVEILKKRLLLRGICVDVAYDGHEAIDYLTKAQPHVMLLDLRMPGMDGLDVLRVCKERWPEVEVIVLTGHGNGDDQAEAHRLGSFAFLRKPANFEELVTQIQKAYERCLEIRKEVNLWRKN